LTGLTTKDGVVVVQVYESAIAWTSACLDIYDPKLGVWDWDKHHSYAAAGTTAIRVTITNATVELQYYPDGAAS
jgi:hypothetical protein